MLANSVPQISLEQAKQLVVHLENNEQAQADELLLQISSEAQSELFEEVGKLTRQLHDSLTNFQLDAKLIDLTQDGLPDAKQRLSYVMEMTEKAANKTMDAIESSLPIADKLRDGISDLKPSWDKLMRRELKLGEFKALCLDLDAFIQSTESNTQQLNGLMTEVLMAQDFQDLTGQVIRRVIELVREVEESLINMLTVFGTPINEELVKEEQTIDAPQESEKPLDQVAEGPILDADSRDDVVSDQDDVDDLLSSLGF